MNKHTEPTRQCTILPKQEGIWLAGDRGGQFYLNLGRGSSERAEHLRKRLAIIRQRRYFLEVTADEIVAALLRHE